MGVDNKAPRHPSIAEVAQFLRKHDEKATLQLLAHGPEFQEAMRVGVMMGDEGVADDADSRDPMKLEVVAEQTQVVARAKARVVAAALPSMVNAAKARIVEIDRQLSLLTTTKFLSGLITLFAAPGTVVLLQMDESGKAMWTSLAATLGSVVQLFAATFVLRADGSETDIAAKGRSLQAAIAFAELAGQTLDALVELSASAETLDGPLREANRLFGELNVALR
ncbi:hypothetical protein ACQ86G_17230 [Roseateles chitinivorans]|uniref:hypothetical protein n=1 Tax=Roseateles chitinivorans TaxID=2917965 RepID=UPI003D66ED2E